MTRSEKIRRLRTVKKVSSVVSAVFGLATFFLMGTMDSEQWLILALIMMGCLGVCFVSYQIVEECDYRIRKLVRPDPWCMRTRY